jgi:hypothetical protein
MSVGTAETGDTDLPFGPIVPWLQLFITERPVDERRASRHAIETGHTEIARMKTPGKAAIKQCAAADHRGIGAIGFLMRADQTLLAIGIDMDARIAIDIRTGIEAIALDAVISQMIAVATVGIAA